MAWTATAVVVLEPDHAAREVGGTDRAAARPGAIAGGTPDPVDVAVVGVADSQRGGTCTGALIAPDLILTAQHCVAAVMNLGPCPQVTFAPPFAATDFYVTTRATISTNPGDFYRVAELRLPPGTQFCGRDLALLRLGAAIPAGEAQPIAPRLDPAPTTGELYAAVGFGGTDDTGADGGARRRRDGLAVGCVGAACASSFVDAAEWNGEAGVCPGDSGGPALDSSGRVIGVASRGAVGCAAPTYTALEPHRSWIIDEAVRAASLGGYPPPPWTGVAPPIDAGLDASAAGDAGDTGPDAGVAGDGDGGGCCAAGAGGDPLAVALAALGLRARRRGGRRSRARRACRSSTALRARRRSCGRA